MSAAGGVVASQFDKAGFLNQLEPLQKTHDDISNTLTTELKPQYDRLFASHTELSKELKTLLEEVKRQNDVKQLRRELDTCIIDCEWQETSINQNNDALERLLLKINTAKDAADAAAAAADEQAKADALQRLKTDLRKLIDNLNQQKDALSNDQTITDTTNDATRIIDEIQRIKTDLEGSIDDTTISKSMIDEIRDRDLADMDTFITESRGKSEEIRKKFDDEKGKLITEIDANIRALSAKINSNSADDIQDAIQNVPETSTTAIQAIREEGAQFVKELTAKQKEFTDSSIDRKMRIENDKRKYQEEEEELEQLKEAVERVENSQENTKLKDKIKSADNIKLSASKSSGTNNLFGTYLSNAATNLSAVKLKFDPIEKKFDEIRRARNERGIQKQSQQFTDVNDKITKVKDYIDDSQATHDALNKIFNDNKLLQQQQQQQPQQQPPIGSRPPDASPVRQNMLALPQPSTDAAAPAAVSPVVSPAVSPAVSPESVTDAASTALIGAQTAPEKEAAKEAWVIDRPAEDSQYGNSSDTDEADTSSKPLRYLYVPPKDDDNENDENQIMVIEMPLDSVSGDDEGEDFEGGGRHNNNNNNKISNKIQHGGVGRFNETQLQGSKFFIISRDNPELINVLSGFKSPQNVLTNESVILKLKNGAKVLDGAKEKDKSVIVSISNKIIPYGLLSEKNNEELAISKNAVHNVSIIKLMKYLDNHVPVESGAPTHTEMYTTLRMFLFNGVNGCIQVLQQLIKLDKNEHWLHNNTQLQILGWPKKDSGAVFQNKNTYFELFFKRISKCNETEESTFLFKNQDMSRGSGNIDLSQPTLYKFMLNWIILFAFHELSNDMRNVSTFIKKLYGVFIQPLKDNRDTTGRLFIKERSEAMMSDPNETYKKQLVTKIDEFFESRNNTELVQPIQQALCRYRKKPIEKTDLNKRKMPRKPRVINASASEIKPPTGKPGYSSDSDSDSSASSVYEPSESSYRPSSASSGSSALSSLSSSRTGSSQSYRNIVASNTPESSRLSTASSYPPLSALRPSSASSASSASSNSSLYPSPPTSPQSYRNIVVGPKTPELLREVVAPVSPRDDTFSRRVASRPYSSSSLPPVTPDTYNVSSGNPANLPQNKGWTGNFSNVLRPGRQIGDKLDKIGVSPTTAANDLLTERQPPRYGLVTRRARPGTTISSQSDPLRINDKSRKYKQPYKGGSRTQKKPRMKSKIKNTRRRITKEKLRKTIKRNRGSSKINKTEIKKARPASAPASVGSKSSNDNTLQ